MTKRMAKSSKVLSIILAVYLLTNILAINLISAASTPIRGGALVVGQTILPRTLDPHMETGGPSFRSTDWLFYDTLVELDSNGNLRPSLAESWQISKDEKEITFNLRKNVVFHDGTKFNAHAVKYNIDRILNPATKCPAVSLMNALDSVKVVDDYTLKVNLKYPDSIIMMVFAQRPGGMIISPAAIEKYGKDLGLNPVGTGPFMLEEWVVGDHITAKRNPNYWRIGADNKPLPYLDKVIVRAVPDDNVKIAELQRGTIQFIDNIPAKDVAAIKKNRKLKTIESVTWWRHIALNVNKAPLNDKKVRHAIAYAIDNERIAKATAFGLGYVTPTITNERVVGYDPKLPIYKYNLKKAQQLMKEAGYAGKQLNLKLTFYSNDPERAIAELVQAQLSKIGIKVSIEFMETSAWIDQMLSGKGEMGISRIEVPYAHPWMLISERFQPWSLGGRNWAGYENSRVIELLSALRKASDKNTQSDLVKQISQIVIEDCPYISLYHQKALRGARSNLQGIEMELEGGWKFYQAWFDK
ncbi:MAG: hypothetical protein GX075_13665 [Firmicutes bacterium]|nr:hypothetical protein [Bacillota bacterium]